MLLMTSIQMIKISMMEKLHPKKILQSIPMLLLITEKMLKALMLRLLKISRSKWIMRGSKLTTMIAQAHLHIHYHPKNLRRLRRRSLP